ncbi:MAG TPA: general secretion pathway protein GspK [Thermodesulfobacteriota bacterium]|nr:general secretion pathway protein GspK [Thermodesulfobacteriota bacterium]
MYNNAGKRESERGVVLLVVLIAVAILTTLVVDLIYFTQIDTTISANVREEIEARYLAKSGIEVMAGTIKEKSLEELDKNTSLFGEQSDSSEGYWALNVPSFPLGDGAFSLKIVDERSKINMNELVGRTTNLVDNRVLTELAELFGMLGIEYSKSSLFIGSLINWLDRPIQGSKIQNDQSPVGADADFYASLDNPYRMKDGPLDSVGEILLIRGMDEEFFDKIKNYVTVYPKDEKVNFSTAPKVVMMAVLKGAAFAVSGGEDNNPISDDVLQSIADAVIEERKENPIINLEKVKEIEKRYNVDSSNSISSGLTILVLNSGKSDVFSVTSTGSLGGENPTVSIIEAVIRKSTSGKSGEVNVISWKER